MIHIDGLHPLAFTQADKTPDTVFYTTKKNFSLLDQGAQEAVKALYTTLLPENGTIVDLMAGHDSHIPADIMPQRLIGLGISKAEMEKNPALDEVIVQDLNLAPTLPFADESIDAICLCDGLHYLIDPLSVLKEVVRVLQPGASLIITYSDIFHPAKAVALWQALTPDDRQRLVTLLLQKAGFSTTDIGEVQPPEDLPLWQNPVYANIGYK